MNEPQSSPIGERLSKQRRAEIALKSLLDMKANHYTPEKKSDVIDQMIQEAEKRLKEAEASKGE